MLYYILNYVCFKKKKQKQTDKQQKHKKKTKIKEKHINIYIYIYIALAVSVFTGFCQQVQESLVQEAAQSGEGAQHTCR